MSTNTDHLTSLLGSEVRARLIVHFVVHPGSSLNVRALGRHVGVTGKRSLQVEVDRLCGLGLLQRRTAGREVLVSRSTASPWKALTLLVQEYAPVHVLRDALAVVPGIQAAFIFGSIARGDARPDSDIDLLVLGDDIPDRALGKAILDASVVLDRALDAKRYTREAFLRDAQPGASFLSAMLRGPKVWVAGSPADLPTPDQAAA